MYEPIRKLEISLCFFSIRVDQLLTHNYLRGVVRSTDLEDQKTVLNGD